MSATIEQTKTGTFTTTNSPTVVWDSNTKSGSTIMVVITMTGATPTVTSITDSQSNTYTFVDTETVGGSTTQFWRAENITSGITPTVSFTLSTLAGTATGAIIIREYSGLLTSATLDKHTDNSGASTAASSGATGTISSPSELIIGWAAAGDTMTLGSGYGNLQVVNNGSQYVALEDMTVTSTGAQTATFTVNSNVTWSCGVATFGIILPAAHSSGMGMML